MQRMHGGYFWICCEIGSRVSEAARIMAEWSCIDEREWMERRQMERRQDKRPKRIGGEGGKDERKFLET